MFLAWYDSDKKKLAIDKIAAGIARYEAKFGRGPALCLCSITDAEYLSGIQAELESALRIEIRGVPHIPRHTYFLGQPDETESVA